MGQKNLKIKLKSSHEEIKIKNTTQQNCSIILASVLWEKL